MFDFDLTWTSVLDSPTFGTTWGRHFVWTKWADIAQHDRGTLA